MCVLTSLDEKYDAHLAQAENLTTLFVSMHDEVCVSTCLLCVSVSVVWCVVCIRACVYVLVCTMYN